MIEVRNLSFRYGETAVLDGVSLALQAGETLAVVGPSGCGKSTLLALLAGLETPGEGGLQVLGRAVLVLQDYGLLPWKTVRENSALGLALRGASWRDADRVLQELGLWDLRHRYPAQLSGGQRQRVGLARALAMHADLLLLDEPFSALDALTREDLQDFLLQIWLRHRPTIVLVTHSIEEAVYLGRRIAVLSPRPARLSALLDNPGALQPGYRKDPSFHAMTVAVRERLERVNGR